MATGLANLGIATAYERGDGVLKRIGATPLPRGGLVAGKLLAVIVLEVLQVAALLLIAAAAYGWRPQGAPALAALALLLGTAAFAGLGLTMAGTLRPEGDAGRRERPVLAPVAPGRSLPAARSAAALDGGRRAPAPRGRARRYLAGGAHPAGVLPIGEFVLLVIWAMAAPLAAALTFRWE